MFTLEMKIEYISRRVDYSRSGANATLEVGSLPTAVGSHPHIYDGSHKHMTPSLYRRDVDSWKHVAPSTCTCGYCGGTSRGKLYKIIYYVASHKAQRIIEEMK